MKEMAEYRKEPLSYKLSADVNIDDLFGFIIENLPYKKVLQLKSLLNASVKTKDNITVKEAQEIFSLWKQLTHQQEDKGE